MAKYQLRKFVVDSEQLREKMVLDNGRQGYVGDWLITRPDGFQFFLSEEQFLESYEPFVPDPEDVDAEQEAAS